MYRERHCHARPTRLESEESIRWPCTLEETVLGTIAKKETILKQKYTEISNEKINHKGIRQGQAGEIKIHQ